jgi:hypothetical protein
MKILVIMLDYNTHVLTNYYITQIVYSPIIRIVTDTLKNVIAKPMEKKEQVILIRK